MPTAYLLPWQATAGISELERLLAMLPDNVYRKDDGLLVSVLAAVAAELERARDALAEEGLQGFPSTATWALGRWERQLGLPDGAGRTAAWRRARAVTRYRGLAEPIGVYMQRRAAGAIGQAALPSIPRIRAGRWAVFKPHGAGWPGDAAFVEAERRLRVAGPAANHFWLAPWDAANGLTRGQMNMMSRAAMNSLTRAEMDGV